MTDVVDNAHLDVAVRLRDQLAAYQESADLIEVGAYVKGNNPRVDNALACRGAVLSLLKQKPNETSALGASLDAARAALTPPAAPVLKKVVSNAR